jgi:hypothetical protein
MRAGMKNATKGVGSLLGAVLVGSIGFTYSLLCLIIVCAIFIPITIVYMDHGLGRQLVKKRTNWSSVFKKGDSPYL